MPVDINRLTEGWLELESDPGTLMENMMRNVSVNEMRQLFVHFFLLYNFQEARICVVNL